MRVIQTKNDIIRLIFNPKTDGLCLSDFLIVRDGKDNFLAQIVEIYDDKFNQEENVASIKLVFRILPDYQVVPYDNFTPSRECEIAKIKPEEIEKCLNIDKVTVPFGISTKNNRTVNVNIDFFNNNPVVFADKLDEVNLAFENITQKLKSHKTVVVIDYTGNLNIKNAKRIKALSDFKLPLDSFSLDYIQEKALREVSPEATSELEDMFVELKKFVDSTEDKYIPFPRFIKVIEQQYKATPAPELHLLLTRLKRYSNDGLFSRSKKEFQAISKAMQKENAIIIDFSGLKFEWHKEFLEFVVRQIREYDAYLLLRLNENNSNPELINDLYIKNPKLNIISSISYGFVKMPQVMEFARNYILYKTLNPRRDFGFANFQIAALNASSFLVFGKDTMDFMFTLKNYIYDEADEKKVEDKKIYIDLNLELEEMTSVELAEGNFDLKNIHIQNNQKRLADEVAIDDILPGYEQNQKERLNEVKNKETIEETEELQEAPVVKENPEDEEEVQNADISDIEDEVKEDVTENEEQEKESEVPSSVEEDIEKPSEVSENIEEVEAPENEASDMEDVEKSAEIEEDIENKEDIIEKEPETPVEEKVIEEETVKEEVIEEKITKQEEMQVQQEAPKKDLSIVADDARVAELIEASLKNDEEYIKEISDNKNNENEIPLKEDELDYFVNPNVLENSSNDQPEAKNTADETDKEEVITSEMINEAIDNEELAKELEEQAQSPLKKNQEADINENKEIKTVNPVAKEPEMIKQASIEASSIKEVKEPEVETVLEEKPGTEKEPEIKEEIKSEAQKEAPVQKSEEETPIAKEEAPAPKKEEPKDVQNEENPSEKESLESIKEEAHSVLEQESVQKALDAVETPKPKPSVNQVVPVDTKVELPAVQEDTKVVEEKVSENKEADKSTEEVSKESVPSEPKSSAKKANPDEAIIIVKEKPNLLIDDFTEEASKPEVQEEEPEEEDSVSLKELAQKSIEARFDEVIGETKAPEAEKKNKLKINDNVSIDIAAIKAKNDTTQSALPIFNNNEEEEETLEYDFTEGMKVSHEKYGTGSILKVVKYSNRCLLQIEFNESGKRLLDPKIAKIKPL